MLVGRNPKSNKPCVKIAAGKKCAAPSFIRARGGARGREERRGKKKRVRRRESKLVIDLALVPRFARTQALERMVET